MSRHFVSGDYRSRRRHFEILGLLFVDIFFFLTNFVFTFSWIKLIISCSFSAFLLIFSIKFIFIYKACFIYSRRRSFISFHKLNNVIFKRICIYWICKRLLAWKFVFLFLRRFFFNFFYFVSFNKRILSFFSQFLWLLSLFLFSNSYIISSFFFSFVYTRFFTQSNQSLFLFRFHSFILSFILYFLFSSIHLPFHFPCCIALCWGGWSRGDDLDCLLLSHPLGRKFSETQNNHIYWV